MSDLESILNTHRIGYPRTQLTNSSFDNVFHYFRERIRLFNKVCGKNLTPRLVFLKPNTHQKHMGASHIHQHVDLHMEQENDLNKMAFAGGAYIRS